MSNSSGLTCYQCGKDDMIQNVPAVVAGGTSQGDFSGPSGGITFIDGQTGYTSGYSHLSGTMTSDLARSLAAPVAPQKFSIWGFVGWSFLFLFSVCIIIGPFLVWPRFKEYIAADEEEQKRVFTPGVKIATIFILCLGWHPMFWPFIIPLKNTINKRLDFTSQDVLWRSVYRRWQNLFYCHRCGIVCDPSTHAAMTPRYMESYLYSNDPAYTVLRENIQAAIPDHSNQQQNAENHTNIATSTNIPMVNISTVYQTAQEQIPPPHPGPVAVPPISTPAPVKSEPAPEKRISLGLEDLFQDESDSPNKPPDQEASADKKWKEIDL